MRVFVLKNELGRAKVNDFSETLQFSAYSKNPNTNLYREFELRILSDGNEILLSPVDIK